MTVWAGRFLRRLRHHVSAVLQRLQSGFRGIAFVPNQAPTLSGTNSNLPAIFENPTSNPGQLVSPCCRELGAAVSDTAGRRQGIGHHGRGRLPRTALGV